MGGDRLTSHRVARLGLALVACTVVVLAVCVGTAHAAGGPVILGGDDLIQHGSRNTTTSANVGGWLYLEKALETVAPAVSRPGNDGSIAALGSSDSTALSADAGAAIHYSAQDAGPGIPVTYYDGGPAISQFFADLQAGTVNPAIIWVSGTGGTNDVSGDPAEEFALLHQTSMTIADFVNSGGGLISHGSLYVWASELFPGMFASVSGATGDLALTAEGSAALPGLTDADVNGGHWHAHFEGNLGGMSTLVHSTTVDDSTGRDARVIVGGLGVLLPGSILLEPYTAAGGLGADHTVTAIVRNDQGQPQSGATVTFTVTAGPNQGETGTGVTDASGRATFSWLGDGGQGVDTVTASVVDPGGSTRTAAATMSWAVTPDISLLPVEAIPVVLAVCGVVAVSWRRRQRRPT